MKALAIILGAGAVGAGAYFLFLRKPAGAGSVAGGGSPAETPRTAAAAPAAKPFGEAQPWVDLGLSVGGSLYKAFGGK